MTRLTGCKQLYALVPGIAAAWNYAEKIEYLQCYDFGVYSSTLYEEWNCRVLRNFTVKF